MDSETQQRIEETVLEILKDADMEVTTEFKVRSMASEKLGLDLSLPDRKRFVRQVVENFLQSGKDAETQQNDEENQEEQKPVQEEEEEEEEAKEEEEEEEEEEEGGKRKREYDDEGNPIICKLSNKRQVTVQDFRGKTLVSIREYYEKDGKQMPSSKGISLTVEQWEAFSNAIPKIEEAIKKLEGEGEH